MADTVEKIISVRLDATAAVSGIMRLNDTITETTAKIRANEKAIAENNRVMLEGAGDTATLERENKKLQRSNVELTEKQKVLKDERRALQREVQNEIRLESQQAGSLKALRAELSNLTKRYDELSRAERENVNVGGRLKAQINQVTTEIKRAEEGTQRYYRNVGNYTNSILAAIGMNGQFSQSLLGLTASEAGVSGAFSAMGASVKAFGASLMALMTNPVFWALAGIAGAGMAFKWFYDYNEGLAEATRLTREFTGLSGDNLIALRNEISATADVMDKEYLDVLKAADSLMSHFHVTGVEAMRIINDGFAAGADLNGDFLQKLQQYGPTFHDAGIGADELVAILQQTRSGIFSDQGLDAIRMGSARIREMSNTTRDALKGIGIDADEMARKLADGSMGTFDAIKQVSAAIKQMPDNAHEVGEVMTAVFGRQGRIASQEMIESLADMTTSLDEVKASTGEYGELLLENINTEKELDEVTAALFDMTDKGWESAKQRATIYAKRALVAVVKGLIDVVNWFVKIYNQSLPLRAALQFIALGFKQIWEVAKLSFSLIVTGFKNMGTMITAFVRSFNIAAQSIKSAAAGIAQVFRGIVEMDGDMILSGVKQIGASTLGATREIAGEFSRAFSSAISGMSGDFSAFFKGVTSNAYAAIDGINSRLTEIDPAVWTDGEMFFLGGGNGGGNGNGGSGDNKTGGKSGDKSGSAGKSVKSPEELAQEAFNKRVADLIRQGEALHRKALQEQSRTNLAAIDELAEQERAELYAVYGDREQYEGEALAAWDAKWQDIEDRRQAATKAYYANIAKQEREEAAALNKQGQQLAQAIIAGQSDGSAQQLQWRLELLRLQQEAELAELDANEEAKTNRREWWEQMRTAIIAKYQKQQTEIEQENADKQRAIQAGKLQAAQSVVGGLSEILDTAAEDNREAMIAQKILAVGEIMLAQAVAIANAVKAGSKATNPWQMIAQIAASVTAVTVAMVQAFQSLDKAKFATGGYIRGAGTSTSDSIPVRVSNGESVMNANTTAMFGGLLSSLNQLGGGVPIQAAQTASSVRGEDMLARAVARGVAMLPAPVVSVEDINRGQRQVEVMNKRARL